MNALLSGVSREGSTVLHLIDDSFAKSFAFSGRTLRCENAEKLGFKTLVFHNRNRELSVVADGLPLIEARQNSRQRFRRFVGTADLEFIHLSSETNRSVGILEGSHFGYFLLNGIHIPISFEPHIRDQRRFAVGNVASGKMALGVGVDIEIEEAPSIDILLFAAVSAIMYFDYFTSQ